MVKRTWAIYKESKEGLVGLGILLTFLCLAIFAPLICEFDPSFVAPVTDIYEADPVYVNLTTSGSWQAPIGITTTRGVGGGMNLTKVLVYSSEGNALLYPVGVREEKGQMKISVGGPKEASVPKNLGFIKRVYAQSTPDLDIFIAVDNSSFYIMDRDLSIKQKVGLDFKPRYFSEIWNRYAEGGHVVFAFANEKNIFIHSIMAHRNISTGIVKPITYTSLTKLNYSTIVSPPLPIFLPGNAFYPNSTMLIIPTATEIICYNITANVTGGIVKEWRDVRLGHVIWRLNLTIEGTVYHLLDENSCIFPYPGANELDFGKERIILATKENKIISIWRSNGTVEWINKFFINSPSYRDAKLRGVHSTERAGAEGILVSAFSGTKGLFASLNLITGSVNDNGTKFNTTEGFINVPPQYVKGLHKYLISTDIGNIYIFHEDFKTNTTVFTVLGGARTSASFLGNIFEQAAGAQTGNYFGIITGKNQLYMDSMTGSYKAPLPPGKYVSGNWYILGTDYEGHDIFAWIVYGTRMELVVGIFAALVAVCLGTFIGIIAGYYGGAVDMTLTGVINILLCLPGLVIMLLMVSVLGASIWSIIVIIGVLGWAGIAWVVRSVTLSLKTRPFIDSARVSGASSMRMIFVHIFPNVLPYTFFFMAITVSGAILTEAALAFLGFGDPNAITWGMMLQYLKLTGSTLRAWWWLLPPGIMITLLSLSFYLIGRAFDEVVNPRLRKR